MDDNDKRIVLVKIEFNKRQLKLAEEQGNPEKIARFKKYIEQYESKLDELERKCIHNE